MVQFKIQFIDFIVLIKMGIEHSKSLKCTVTTLNYSGIYLSPFEYYGIDNWQQLQSIGKIFQEQLKKAYPKIMEQSLRLNSLAKFESKVYSRETFQWQIGDIGKEVQTQRYSPLYVKQQSFKIFIAGIKTSNSSKNPTQHLLDRQQFFNQWDQQFNKIKSSSSSLHRYQCKVFDFLCYKSMILYLNENSNMKDRLYVDYRAGIYIESFNQIVETTKQNQNAQIIRAYKELLRTYSKRIPPNKIEFTINHLFKSNNPEIIILPEASQQIITQLNKKPQYFGFIARVDKKTKKTLLLVKRSLPFCPKEDEKTVWDKNDYNLLLDSEKSISKTAFLDQLGEYKKYIPRLKQFFISKYLKNKQTLNKSSDGKPQNANKLSEKVTKFLEKLSSQGVVKWIADEGVITRFPRQKEVFIAAFHFSSNEELNTLQIQIMGLILYHLVCIKKAKFIFGGDFNSFVRLVEQDNLGLFSFVEHIFEQKSNQINSMIKSIRIFPQHSMLITAKKKRTILQPQSKKANVLFQKCIDHILTNYPLLTKSCHVCEIGDIGSRQTENQNFLPHSEHPYDHFLVEGTLDLAQQLP